MFDTMSYQREHLLSKEDLIPAEGVIIDKQPNAFSPAREQRARRVGADFQDKKSRIRILMGDRVSVDVAHDLTRGIFHGIK